MTTLAALSTCSLWLGTSPSSTHLLRDGKSSWFCPGLRPLQRSCSTFASQRRRNCPVQFGSHLITATGTAATGTNGNLLRSVEGVQVYDPAGVKVPLSSLWENRKAVVALARHFGCVLCRKRAALLEERKEDFEKAGVALVLIAPGVPEQARKFLERNKFSGEVYSDPDYAAYKALGVAQGAFSVINPKSGQRVLQALAQGWTMDWDLSGYSDTIRSGAWLQGGILVAGPGIDSLQYFLRMQKQGTNLT